MPKALLAVLLLASASAAAQSKTSASPASPDTSAATSGGTPSSSAPAASTLASGDARIDEMRREMELSFEKKLEDAKAAMRDEIRAQLAAQQANDSTGETFLNPRQHLDILVPHGYLRVRPDLFNKFDLNREPYTVATPNGNQTYYLFPRSPASSTQRTITGANMRFRFEPTINVSEDVRIQSQIDVLDNLVLGSTPDYAFSRSQLNEFDILSMSQATPAAGLNAALNSIQVKRVWGEVNTPIGVFRFGRMGSQFGLGMLHNDGNCLNCDHGETVDRLQLVIEPIAGYFITPMFDFNVTGPTSATTGSQGQPFDLSNSANAHSFVIVAAHRDTDAQAKAKLEQGGSVLNYGVHFTYRYQHADPTGYFNSPYVGQGGDPAVAATLQNQYTFRGGNLYIPDVWIKFERKNFRIELEAAGVFGSIASRNLSPLQNNNPSDTQSLQITQFGAVLQGEYRLLNDALKINVEIGFASGDKAPGMGYYAGRAGSGTGNNLGNTEPGDFDGRQYACQQGGGCTDNSIRNFRFNQDYRIDMILWREIIGGLTDALYIRPSASYTIAEGFQVYAAVIYSRAIYASSTPSDIDPSKADANLGIEINAGAEYKSDDGFFVGVQYGILFPLAGLSNTLSATPNKLDNAQAVRGYFGVKF